MFANRTQEWALKDEAIFATSELLLRKISNIPALSRAFPTLKEEVTRNNPEEPYSAKHEALCSCAPDSAKYRRLFVTPSDYLGFGPHSLAEDDEVWLLVGGKTPFVLRRADEGRYRLVGEAYIHGAMFGELMTDEVIKRIAPVEII